jgi:hypothetical protein
MICFPDLDRLELALSRGAVPPAACRVPSRAGVSLDGRPCIHPAPALAAEGETALRQLGATWVDLDPALLDRDIYCWHQLLPLRPDTAPGLADAPVLFELTHPPLWPALAGEFRRLGRGFPAFSWQGEEEDGSLLLRTTNPPQAALLRAAEPAADGLRVYREQTPRVWVEAGWRLPLAEQVVPPADKIVLIRRPGIWTLCGEVAFAEALAEFPLPEVSGASAAATIADRPWPAQLRLVPRRHEGQAEFWVLRDRPVEQLASLANDLDDALLARLDFAMVEMGGSRIAVLRIRPSRQPPPVFVLAAPGFRACLKLPNLFVPLGSRLHPALRRDVVRRLLADDPDRIVWLTPQPDGGFIRESVAVAAFSPLAERVDYATGQEPRPLRAWTPAFPFEFETFISTETAQPLSELRKSLGGRAGEAAGALGWFLDRCGRFWDWLRERLGGTPSLPANPPADLRSLTHPTRQLAPAADRVAEAVRVFLQPADGATAIPSAPVASEQPRHMQLEKRFLGLSGPPDLPERRALWPELAAAYQGLSNWNDAALCWLNALWESEGSDLWVWGWQRAEEQSAHWTELERDLERVLSETRPEAADIRALAGLVVFSARQAEPPRALRERLGRLRACLENNERLLPVRAVWLCWLALSRLAGGDVLSLARSRDRLFERLLRRGLNHELDLPGFLRGAGPGAGQRAELIRDWLAELPNLVNRWIDLLYGREGWGEPLRQEAAIPEAQPGTGLLTERWLGKPPPYGRDAEPHFTRALCDLTIAWGLGRLGGAAPAGRIVGRAQEVLDRGDAVHRYLLDAYVQRINEAVERSPDMPGPLPRLADVETMTNETRYKIDFLLSQSRILEPHDQAGSSGPIRSVIYMAEQGEQIDRLLSQSARSTADQSDFAPALAVALSKALDGEEGKARELLGLVEPTILELSDEVMQVRLVARGLAVAAQFGFLDHLSPLSAHLERQVEKHRSTDAAAVFESLAELSFRRLRRLGLSERIDQLLARVAERILPAPWGRSSRPLAELLSAEGWRGLLHVAGGWFGAGQEDQAFFVLDQVRYILIHGRITPHQLLDGRLPPKEQVRLACAYATALGQAPLKEALRRLEQLFAELARIHFKHTTNSHYSLALLDVVETVVRAVADDDFAVEAGVRRWLDEDEYLVRRRIHRDLRAIMGQAGIQ